MTNKLNLFKELFAPIPIPDIGGCNWNTPGKMLSYVGSCSGGRTTKRYGICDDIKDYKISLKVYDGPYCIRDPDFYWKGRIRELDLSLSKGDQIDLLLDSFFETVTQNLFSRGATFVDASIPVNKVSKIEEEGTPPPVKRKYN
ncbi:unnamed protein product [Brugia timori]|uniref:Uncharacterized protein n=1 Tax=Brugia timori TaxID=42155 RepID=A0A0R3QHG3_9BILA|nr:unnamed protein product [Brugia timori]